MRARTLTGHRVSVCFSSALEADSPRPWGQLETHQIPRLHVSTWGPRSTRPHCPGAQAWGQRGSGPAGHGADSDQLQDACPPRKACRPWACSQAVQMVLPGEHPDGRSLLCFTETPRTARAKEAKGWGLQTAAQPGANPDWQRDRAGQLQGPAQATHVVTGGVCRIIPAQTSRDLCLRPLHSFH